MESWKVWLQVNSEDRTDYVTVDVEITEEEKDVLENALREGRPLRDTNVGIMVMRKAEVSINFEDWLDYEYEPCRENCASDEEYEEEMADFKAKADEYCFAETIIHDPGDYGRFLKKFVGRVYPAAPDYCGEAYEFEAEEYDDRIVRYEGRITFNRGGVLTGIEIDRCEGLEWESIRYSDYSDCYPDYEFLAERIEELLAKIKPEE